MTLCEAGQYRTAESSTCSQQKYRYQSQAATANPSPVAALPTPDPGCSSWPWGAAGPLTSKRVMRRVIWTHGGPAIVLEQQALGETLQIIGLLGCFGIWAHWDLLSRNDDLWLVCSIAAMHGMAGWAVCPGQCIEHDARASLTKGYCSLLF